MYQQIEVIIAQSREFTRRRNLLDPNDQKRADYLLKRIDSIRGGICYAILLGFYFTLALPLLFAVPLALVAVVTGDGELIISLIIIGMGVFWVLLGSAVYLRGKRKRIKFQCEIAADHRLTEVFKTMGFRLT